MSKPAMYRDGRWGLSQLMPPDAPAGRPEPHWQAVGSIGYRDRSDALDEVYRLNLIQPGRWRIRDREL